MTNRLTVEMAEAIVDEILNLENTEVKVRKAYSGRGMFGNEVVAFVFADDVDMLAIGYAAARLGYDLADLPTRTDSMGRGIVLY